MRISSALARKLGLSPPGKTVRPRRPAVPGRRLPSRAPEPSGEVVLELDLLVVPKERPRSSSGHFYIPSRTRKFVGRVREIGTLAMRRHSPFSGPVEADVLIVLPIPRSWSVARRRAAEAGLLRPTRRPDLDNAEKSVFDALNGIVYLDDAQITDKRTRKRYGAAPRLRLAFRRAEAEADD